MPPAESACCPFHTAHRKVTRTVPMTEQTDLTLSIHTSGDSPPDSSRANSRRTTGNPSPHGRTLSQKMLHSGDKLKKLFRTSSNGNSIDGSPAHPLTISVSSCNLAADLNAGSSGNKSLPSEEPENDDNQTVLERTVPVERQSGGSGIIMTSSREDSNNTTREHQESIRSTIHYSSGRVAYHHHHPHSHSQSPTGSTIDQTSSAAVAAHTRPPPLSIARTSWHHHQQQQQSNSAFELSQPSPSEIKSKLTTDRPGRDSSGSRIIKTQSATSLLEEPTSNNKTGTTYTTASTTGGIRPAALIDGGLDNTDAALASLSSILSSASVSSANGRTLPPFPPQVLAFENDTITAHVSGVKHMPRRRGFSDDIVSDDTTTTCTTTTGSSSNSTQSSTSIGSHQPEPRLYRPGAFTMRSRTPGASSPNFHSSLMYHPASVPHLPLDSDHDSIKVLNTRNTGDDYVYLNQYKLSNETLGHGTYSIVKLAYNTEDNINYAMKILSKKKLMKKHRLTRKSGDPMQEAHREIAILKKLNHPNIIRLVEVLDDPSEDSLYMVFELLERGEVLVIPTDHPLHESTARRLFRDLILGVEYLHYNGILHRDLKPSNLLLDDNGRLKIADFGLSHMFDGKDDLLSGTVGTPAFHAPEILTSSSANTVRMAGGSSPASRSGSLSRTGSDSDGERMMNRKVLCSGVAMDIWSMGITLYSLVFGEVPFRDQFIVGLYNEIKSSSPQFPPDIVTSDQLQDVILRLLEKDPERRITLSQLRWHPWITQGGNDPLTPSAEDNCQVQIEITEEDILSSVRSIPHLDTLILIKAMLKRGSFHHPFKNNEDNRKGSLDSNLPVKPASST